MNQAAARTGHDKRVIFGGQQVEDTDATVVLIVVAGDRHEAILPGDLELCRPRLYAASLSGRVAVANLRRRRQTETGLVVKNGLTEFRGRLVVRDQLADDEDLVRGGLNL